jgi:predicted amidohydrolase YtcJ
VSRRKAFVNGTVYLGQGESIDRGFVVTDGPTIALVGRQSDFSAASDLEIFDVSGHLVLPGLVDCHVHLVAYAFALVRIDLAAAPSLEEGLVMIRERLGALPKGAWLLGRGWDKQRWGLSAFPTKQMLDPIAPDNPVALVSRDGHLMWVNSAAITSLGLRGGTEVEGGEIETGPDGKPTGVLKEKAANLVLSRAYLEDPQEAESVVRNACGKLIGSGLTCVHTVENADYAELLNRTLASGPLDIGLVRMREVWEPDEIDRLSPSDCTFIKILADGTLGSQTASMLKPYCGQPDNLGIQVIPKQQLHDMVKRSLERGFSIAVHAIGDRANMELLDVYEALRHLVREQSVLRVEHAQVLRSEDIARFGRLGVIASMQPIHLVSDMDVADKYWGERAGNAYAWKSIIDGGGTVAFGSDAPIEEPDPLKGIHAAVARKHPGGHRSSAWNPSECLSVAQAIDAYTIGAAAAAGRSHVTGKIAKGFSADLTILDRNVLSAESPDILLETSVHATVTRGRVSA